MSLTWVLGPMLAVTLVLCAGPSAAAPIKLTLVVQADDPRFERLRSERAYLGQATGPALDAVKMALSDAAFELDAAKLSMTLDTVAVTDAAAARAAALQADKAGAVLLLADLNPSLLLALTDATAKPVLNIGASDDSLRERDCRARLWHLLPSERMRSDALAQALVSRKWAQVLLLSGPSTQDAERSAAALASLRRYGLKLVAHKSFKAGNDPREREHNNPLLLTGQASYDVVWVVDSDGEFARGLPYRTALPRPVVGDAGLAALAWHAQFERYGAPQPSRRFLRATGRTMTGQDWAAWMAGKAVVAAALALQTSAGKSSPATPEAWGRALAAVSLDGSKGSAMDFRAWDGQLRQPLLLSDGVGVIGLAPAEGLLHPRTVLDTLGADAPEALCKVKR